MLSPGVGLAQIPSGSQAGGNSGNNTSGSSNTPISTPSFTPAIPVPSIPGVIVSSPSQITASQPQITAMQTSVQTAAGPSPLFAQIVATTAPTQIVAGPEAQLPRIIVNDLNNFEETTSFAELPSVLSRPLNLGTPIIVTNTTIGVTGTITTSGSGVVTVELPASSPLQITTTPETSLAVVQFAAIAIAAGLTTTSIQAGVQILPVLLPIVASSAQAAYQAVVLLAALQGLAGQNNLANLNQAVITWNQLISTASNQQLLALAANSTFIGIGDVLRAAVGGLAGS